MCVNGWFRNGTCIFSVLWYRKTAASFRKAERKKESWIAEALSGLTAVSPAHSGNQLLRQHRTNSGARLAWSLFRHIAHLFLDNRQVACGKSVQSDEKICFAIRTPELCGVALMRNAEFGMRNCGRFPPFPHMGIPHPSILFIVDIKALLWSKRGSVFRNSAFRIHHYLP